MPIDLTSLTRAVDQRLTTADRELTTCFPGESSTRQPVHTVYVPADRFGRDAVASWAEQARVAFGEVADADGFADMFGIQQGLAADVRARVAAKLEAEPIEDLRIDFEDGYGSRPEGEEDAAVDAAADILREAIRGGQAPPFSGIRFKCFEAPVRHRGLRTLSRFIERLTGGGQLPSGFVITFPKVTSTDQVEAMVFTAEQMESQLGLAADSLRFEIQVETPQCILGPDGTALVARMIHLGKGRVSALHYGTYDYSAFCGISAPYQSMEHPVADHAKATMQVAAAGTGVRLSDGSTNVIPTGDPATVQAVWRLHSRLVRRSLERGYYQGWDMHPTHLVSRYAATFAFYREGLPAAAERLRNYVQRRESTIMDEPATARALADFVVRALDCGATTDEEMLAMSELTREQLNQLARRG